MRRDLLETMNGVELPAAALRASWLHTPTQAIKVSPSIYRTAGSISGTGRIVFDVDPATIPDDESRKGVRDHG